MARPGFSSAFKNAQGKTVVVTPADLGLDKDASDADKLAAKQNFQKLREDAKNDDQAAQEAIAGIVDRSLNRGKGETFKKQKKRVKTQDEISAQKSRVTGTARKRKY